MLTNLLTLIQAIIYAIKFISKVPCCSLCINLTQMKFCFPFNFIQLQFSILPLSLYSLPSIYHLLSPLISPTLRCLGIHSVSSCLLECHLLRSKTFVIVFLNVFPFLNVKLSLPSFLLFHSSRPEFSSNTNLCIYYTPLSYIYG